MNHYQQFTRNLLMTLFLFSAFSGQAQDEVVTLSENSPVLVSADPADTIKLEFIIAPGYYIHSDSLVNPAFIATRIDWTFIPVNFSLKDPVYPEAQPFKVGGEQTMVFSDTVLIRIPVQTDEQPAGTYSMSGELYYQACDTEECSPLNTLNFSFKVTN